MLLNYDYAYDLRDGTVFCVAKGLDKADVTWGVSRDEKEGRGKLYIGGRTLTLYSNLADIPITGISTMQQFVDVLQHLPITDGYAILHNGTVHPLFECKDSDTDNTLVKSMYLYSKTAFEVTRTPSQ